MQTLATIMTALIALIHFYILYLEMFQWSSPRTMKAFDLTPEFAAQTKAMAANQSLYNGFLAACLAGGLLTDQFTVKVFFLLCVLVAGIFGAVSTRNPRIHFFQTIPAAVGLLLL